MRIIFSALGSGFANNGGSKTILSCANELVKLGHDVRLATTNWDFSWFKVHAKRVNHFPDDADVIIATAVATVDPLVKFNSRAKKFWYVRGWETWAVSNEKMIESVRKLPVIVNSEWLRKRVYKCSGKKPKIVYPGVDDHFFIERSSENEIPVIGGLYHSKGLKRFNLWVKVVRKVLSNRRVKVRLFGNERGPKGLPFEFDYVRQPSPSQHRGFYNSCDIWFFTSENEGLHIPPMEAGFCGCSLVGSDIGGVRDYAVHGETALLGDDYVGNIIELVDDVVLRRSLSDNLLNLLQSKIGRRRENMVRFVNVLTL